ncbi:MAG: ATP phosphoribosyltransferase regulatory subunit, partial [Candidatus ainarchaeum sp.]|nr:ATP phosphoribosyltransferase regulatory subunit [Candidatus ainarchaeum sp.]
MKFQTVRGMRDFLPEQAKKKQAIEDKIRREFEAYGFEPLETPIVEDFELLAAKGSAGEAIKEEIYYFKDKSDRELGLRFDLTVPLARVVASNPQLIKPFKRYQIGPVYRYDRPGAKRYRSFTQADADIIGSASILADFELIALGYKIMKNLGLKFFIKVSNKALL